MPSLAKVIDKGEAKWTNREFVSEEMERVGITFIENARCACYYRIHEFRFPSAQKSTPISLHRWSVARILVLQ